ncbi:hypothetical protein B481_0364 [Planococcus halocryophilus Or1]|nr:hypothetical protein B481_0364 [Planococcus halocryophilus Or1]
MGSKQAYLYNFIETLGFWAIALFLYFQALWVLERGYLAKYVKG